ncbi:esterase-like activity of phytase family protein [Pararhizobium sp.]|uniref:esterase-like activity of phytase family protein n=1 Tax=Pararhizobium sp. TaxID=1977563 RepID=UPI0027276A21|nr:esterase-like activity of phytase family protein [Pararhizobium sp.]MDO9417463.1 esterase-like activity of phytase family protein [Pararhizobium sp.]
MRSSRFAALSLALFLGSLPASPAFAEGVTVPVKSRAITEFKIGSAEKTFGPLEFLGGIEMTSSDSLLGSLSSIRFRPNGRDFVAIMDTGHWAEGSIERDASGHLSGLADLTVTSMRDRNGESENIKYRMDAEGLALHGETALVSYERYHRVDVFADPGFALSKPSGSLDILIPIKELRGNGGLETVAVSPLNSTLAGATVVVAERSVDEEGNLFAAILDGPGKGIFKVVRRTPFDVTDGAFLPNGDLLLLERRFNFGTGIGMQIRRIAGSSIKAGAVVDGEILLDADFGYQIDNMEGLDVVAGPGGEVRIVLVSDDNHSILQRNLMLEFRLLK